ncbi:MAG TPA: Holliday junction branch migration protein RuvA [Bacteroidales bacterium]|nr:Holliday junction branch migration protein RuvA [Bacteroidales bacterium]
MYEFIEGKLKELTPAYAIMQLGGIGYLVQISLNTYSQLNSSASKDNCNLFVHQVIREDAQLLFGFYTKLEREIFRLLITVSGVGANTARMILSSMNPDEISKAIADSNVNALKNVKGIGLKTAQRIIVDLKDKINLSSTGDENFLLKDNRIKDEALNALVTLGFPKSTVDKVLDKLLSAGNQYNVEDLVKQALKNL